jgi:hypothetical protein
LFTAAILLFHKVKHQTEPPSISIPCLIDKTRTKLYSYPYLITND